MHPVVRILQSAKPLKVLNLFAGLGGNRKDWENVEVTAVEMDPRIAAVYQRLHPQDTVIVGDAHAYLLENFANFDFVWTSPPCQTHSKMARATRHALKRYPDMMLYQEIIFLRHYFTGPWIVENVTPYYEPLIPAQILRNCVHPKVGAQVLESARRHLAFKEAVAP